MQPLVGINHYMKSTKQKIREFFKIEIDYHCEQVERHFKATISLWHFVWVIANIAFFGLQTLSITELLLVISNGSSGTPKKMIMT